MTRRIGCFPNSALHSLPGSDGEDQRLRRLPRQFGGIRVATTRLKLRQISLHVRRLPQMSQGFFQDCGRDCSARRSETVVHPSPLAPRGDDARAAQVRQVTRDFRLADLEDLHEIADANFRVGDQVEETKPRAIGQSAKEEIEGERFFFPGHAGNYIWLDTYEQGSVSFIHTHKRIYIFGWEALWQRNT